LAHDDDTRSLKILPLASVSYFEVGLAAVLLLFTLVEFFKTGAAPLNPTLVQFRFKVRFSFFAP
jgi:hypothetical protein